MIKICNNRKRGCIHRAYSMLGFAVYCFLFLLSCDKKGGTSSEQPLMPTGEHEGSAGTANTPRRNMILGIERKTQDDDRRLPPNFFDEMSSMAPTLKMVREMGAKKDEKSVATLLDLMPIVRSSGGSPMNVIESYPCAKSLIQIGEPAVEQVQERILSVQNDVLEYILQLVLIEIKGGSYVAKWIDSAQNSKAHTITKEKREKIRSFALSMANNDKNHGRPETLEKFDKTKSQ